jgi:hypothetical protein
MAGEAKFGKKAAEEVIDLLKQAKSGDQLETLATKTGFDVEVLDDVVQKGIGKGGAKGGKDLLKSVVEKLGGTIENVQAEVNTLLGRTRDVTGGQVPPSAKGMVETTGPVDTTRGKGFTLKPKTLALPPGKETAPSRVSSEFAKETTTPTGFTLKTEVPADKALVPVKQPEFVESELVDEASPRMSKLADTAQQGLVPTSGPFNKRMFTDAEIAEMASKAKPGQAGKGIEEIRKSQTPAQQAMEAATAPKPPQMSTAKRAAAAGLVGLGAGFSKEANAPTTIKAAEVDKVQDLSPAINKAVDQGAVTPEQKSVLEDQAQQLEIAAQSLEQKLTTEYEKKKARVELMQLAETVMSGLVTAIGANALLNRGSPYAVDFSKGPKTDWAGEFDRLQKDYSTQMGAIMQKYKLEAAEKRAQAREEAQESRFQRTMEMREKELEAKQGQVAGTAAQKAQEKAAAAKDKAFAELSGALASLKEKSTPISTKQVVANATKLGIPKEEIDLLVSKTTGKGLFNLADEDKVAEILEKYRPGQQAAAPAAQAEALVDMVAPDGRALKVPAARVSELEAKGARRK